MTLHSIEIRNMNKNISKTEVKTRAVNTTRKFLIILRNLPQIWLNLLQKE